MPEREIRQAGLAIDIPFELPDPTDEDPIVYGKDDGSWPPFEIPKGWPPRVVVATAEDWPPPKHSDEPGEPPEPGKRGRE